MNQPRRGRSWNRSLLFREPFSSPLLFAPIVNSSKMLPKMRVDGRGQSNIERDHTKNGTNQNTKGTTRVGTSSIVEKKTEGGPLIFGVSRRCSISVLKQFQELTQPGLYSHPNDTSSENLTSCRLNTCLESHLRRASRSSQIKWHKNFKKTTNTN